VRRLCVCGDLVFPILPSSNSVKPSTSWQLLICGGSAVRFAQVQLPTGQTAPAQLSVSLRDGVVVRGSEVRVLAALVRALRGEPC